MRWKWTGDIIVSIIAVVVGFIVFSQLHGKWFHGGWMQLFGDPPSLNPAYKSLRPLFLAAPFVGSGVTAGLLAGIGLADWRGLVPRIIALTIFFIGLAVINQPVGFSIFPPSIVFSFLISAATSYIHAALSNKHTP